MPARTSRRARGAATAVAAFSIATSVVAPATAFASELTIQPGARAVAGSSEITSPAPVADPAPPCVRPNQGPLTSPFGQRWGRLHEGIDFGGPLGSPIHALKDGVVTFAGPQAGYGQIVTIKHADGMETAYAHMPRPMVTVGQHVTAGQVIAGVGNEGHSTGPHLHFEVRQGSTKIDPVPYLATCGMNV